MKFYSVLLIIVFGSAINIFSQVQFMPDTITTSANGAKSVFAIDLDGDGDMDVLSASVLDDKIAWYENDGNENFTPNMITTSANGASSVYAIDVDGDGDIDVLSASQNDNKIAWYENDGNEIFTTHTITTGSISPSLVYALDIDGDSDVDVLSSAFYDTIAWYENDGNENFTTHTITTIGIMGVANSVYPKDVDGDGDIDVLGASHFDNIIIWYENDGNENFTAQTITTNANFPMSVYAVDLDDDGDMDVMSASLFDHKIAWYENDGNENFTTHIITTNALNAVSVFAADVDNDGDIDVLSASQNDNKIAWYDNDGNENFTTHTITTDLDGARSVYAVDVDGDGDFDVLSASWFDAKIAWYENLSLPVPVELISFTAVLIDDNVILNWKTATEVENYGFEIQRASDDQDFTQIAFVSGHGNSNSPKEYSYTDSKVGVSGKYYYRLKQIDTDGDFEYSSVVEVFLDTPETFKLSQNYPNPFNPLTTIKFQIPDLNFVTLKIYDVLGEEVETLVNGQKNAGTYEITWNAKNLPSGIYFYRLKAGDFLETEKMILMK